MKSTLLVEPISVGEYAEKAYLDYSMYVILDRALPHIADGLKPVQRRIVYAMSELGLKSTAKFKKSARTVGDVLGKFHPHGDSACYEALVLMAQPFSYRYPLVEGQGNFGSTDDPKSFAAMRYTESRLSAFADLLLNELEEGTVEWTLNFDGTLHEPVLLPAKIPHVILNGTTGIAVGMATDIPPHNVNEVIDALLHLLQFPDAGVSEVMKFIKAPDYPTQAEIITSKSDLKEMYERGHGSVRMRAVFIEEDEEIVITALPYQVSGGKVLEQIAAQMQDKKLPWLTDLRDESDHENPVRLILIPRSNRVEVGTLMDHLFATTDLEKSYRVNLNMIGLNGRPHVKNLAEILSEWLLYRSETVRKKITYRLEKIEHRLHILIALMIVYLNINQVIRIIREEDHARALLIKTYNLSDIQVDAILDMRLRHLARLEEKHIDAEKTTLEKEQKKWQVILKSPQKLKEYIAEELTAIAKTHGSPRRSPLVARTEAQAFNEKELLSIDPITVVLSKKGWIRAAKGHEIDAVALSYKAGDEFLMAAPGKSNQNVNFFDNTGRVYAVSAHNLPSARGQGEPLTGRLSPPDGAQFNAVFFTQPDQLYVLASSSGYGFICPSDELNSKNRNGKLILTVTAPASSLVPKPINHIDADWVAVLSSQQHLLIFPIKELPLLAKGKGNKLIHLADKESVRDVAVCATGQTLTLLDADGKKQVLKPQEWKAFCSERAKRGSKLPKSFKQVVRFE